MAENATLVVTGMHCASCGLLIDETLEELSGVISSSTDLRRETTTVQYDPGQTSPAVIAKEISRLGYSARLPEDHAPHRPKAVPRLGGLSGRDRSSGWHPRQRVGAGPPKCRSSSSIRVCMSHRPEAVRCPAAVLRGRANTGRGQHSAPGSTRRRRARTPVLARIS